MAPRDEVKVEPADLIDTGQTFTEDGTNFAALSLPTLEATAAACVPGSKVQAALADVDEQMLEMRQTISGHLKNLGASISGAAHLFVGADEAGVAAITSVSPLNQLPPDWQP